MKALSHQSAPRYDLAGNPKWSYDARSDYVDAFQLSRPQRRMVAEDHWKCDRKNGVRLKSCIRRKE